MNRLDIMFNSENKILDISVKESFFVDASLVFNKKNMWMEYKAVLKSLNDFIASNRLNNNKCFIYFLCTRPHIDITGFIFKKNYLVIKYTIFGKHKAIKANIDIIQDNFGWGIHAINYINGSVHLLYQNTTLVVDIHNFLRTCEINIGEGTNIHYIGYTKNPLSRPINGSHKGWSKVLFQNRNCNLDYFIVYNSFSVNILNSSKNVTMSFNNEFMNEITPETEGLLVEKLMIYFFLNKNILDNYENEIKEFDKHKLKLKKMFYKYLFLTFGFNENSEYYHFYSKYRQYEPIHTYEEEIHLTTAST